MPDSNQDDAANRDTVPQGVLYTQVSGKPPLGDMQLLADICNRLHSREVGNLPLEEKVQAVDDLYAQGMYIVAAQTPSLACSLLPVPGKTRQLVRQMQALLDALALEFLKLAETIERTGYQDRRTTLDRALWRSMYALSRHLFVGELTAAPATEDIWRRLHQTFGLANQTGTVLRNPSGSPYSLKDAYCRAVLLGCAQPASFTGAEIAFLDEYLERYSGHADLDVSPTQERPATFWIDPARDAPATSITRQAPPAESRPLYLSCGRLVLLLEAQSAALSADTLPERIDLPAFAGKASGRSVLNRLASYWGAPGKRRFPRRRQNYRAQLCVGFKNLCRLFGTRQQPVDTSMWMITNESPDGYAAMHATGKAGPIAVGDVAALKTESGENWQLCIIRWALSENQEHIEIGLQILSTRAAAANIALRSAKGTDSYQPALVLPAMPALQTEEALVVPVGTLSDSPDCIVLVLEKENIEVREVTAEQRGDQSGQIEIYEIRTMLRAD